MNNKPLHIRQIDAGSLKEVIVKTGRGRIECFFSESEEFRVEVYAEKLTIESLFVWQAMSKEDFDKLGFTIRNSGGRLNISAAKFGRDILDDLLAFKKVSFRLFLPRNCSVNLQTFFGDLRINGLNGRHQYNTRFGSVYLENLKGSMGSTRRNFGRRVEMTNCEGDFRIASGGGNLSIQHCSGDMDLHTDGGNIKILNFNGRLTCKTRGGNVFADRFSGELKASSWGGNIKIEALNGNLTANTMGGNVSLVADRIENYAWLETSGGNITFDFNEEQKLDITARGNRVKASGNFTFQGKKSKNNWRGEINGGGADVRLKTSGGQIRINGKHRIFPGPHAVSSSITEKAKVPEQVAKPEVEARPRIVAAPVSKSAERKETIKDFDSKINSKRWDQYPRFVQFFLAVIFITLLTYGINTFFYFSKELVNPTSVHSEENVAVFYLNLVNGLIAFIATWFFISVLDNRIRRNWLKYVILILCTYFTYFLGHGILVNLVRNGNWEPGTFLHYYAMMIDNSNGDMGSFGALEAVMFTSIPVLAACAFFAYWNRSRNLNQRLSEQELQLLNLEKLKTKAQLNALEARINPHFLYNSLNSIAGLIHENPDQAEDMTIELSKLFRATTGRKDESFHTIEDELSLVKSYLAIEQMRFGDRLSFEINVEPELNSHRIPRFLLQPLVENAIKHGISKIAENGRILIDIHTKDNNIEIIIHDNGPAFGEAMSGGYGLKSVRDKLNLIYEGKASLEISNEPAKQLTILIDKNHEL